MPNNYDYLKLRYLSDPMFAVLVDRLIEFMRTNKYSVTDLLDSAEFISGSEVQMRRLNMSGDLNETHNKSQ